jgi:hypothetical protein
LDGPTHDEANAGSRNVAIHLSSLRRLLGAAREAMMNE